MFVAVTAMRRAGELRDSQQLPELYTIQEIKESSSPDKETRLKDTTHCSDEEDDGCCPGEGVVQAGFCLGVCPRGFSPRTVTW